MYSKTLCFSLTGALFFVGVLLDDRAGYLLMEACTSGIVACFLPCLAVLVMLSLPDSEIDYPAMVDSPAKGRTK